MNLERDPEALGYAEASAAAAPAGDVRLNHPNAELDFREKLSPSSTGTVPDRQNCFASGCEMT